MTALTEVRHFIRSLHRGLEHGVFAEPGDLGMMLSRLGVGTLSLSIAEARQFSAKASRLFKEFVKREDLSRRSVEQHLQDAIFSALDIRNQSDQTFDERLEVALKRLNRSLTQPAMSYTCYIPVGGLAKEGLPRSFGGDRIIVLGEPQVRAILASQQDIDELPRSNRRQETLDTLRQAASWGEPAILTEVTARDFEAGWQLALRKAGQIIDILNFFSDLVPYNHGWAYLPGEAARVMIGTCIVRADGTRQTRLSVDGPTDLFSLRNLGKAKRLRPVLRRTQDLMRRKPRTGLADTFLTSMEWAGRASVETKREQAFLLFAIALETIVLPKSRTDELTYRLSTRVPHLLTQDRRERRELSTELKKLYKIRSQIVHSGSYDVKEEDFGRLKAIAKRTIVRILLHRRIHRFLEEDELEDWFNQKVLD